eukprot:GGOE01042600.1.p4 GENE.GGOE01042600.1~~GGOE01042600.1.p4  ORF type:complete len:150 (+),score=30.61 GGOE01042600.1:351-800(+)
MTAGDVWEVYVPPPLGFPTAPLTVGKWAMVRKAPSGAALDWYFPQPADPVGGAWVPADSPLNITVLLVSFGNPHSTPDPHSPLTCPSRLEQQQQAEPLVTPRQPAEPPTRCPYKKAVRFVKRAMATLVDRMVLLLPMAPQPAYSAAPTR